ncbi:MAG: NAD(P)/FAD-dependent oxidoreductase, partial [Candidatus Altiarchaeota archaeon]|nr:NAD(P)/FAD-dependent oxidoreductase [Candidatus Altiarchaeota archaeon]
MIYDVVIVGGGPAGLSSGIYTVRRELKTLLVEKGVLGGQMLLTSEIENYPGFSRVSGRDLAEKMEGQVRELGV